MRPLLAAIKIHDSLERSPEQCKLAGVLRGLFGLSGTAAGTPGGYDPCTSTDPAEPGSPEFKMLRVRDTNWRHFCTSLCDLPTYVSR